MNPINTTTVNDIGAAVRKTLSSQVAELVNAVKSEGATKAAHKWRRKMTTAVYAVSWGAVVTEFYIAEAKNDTETTKALESFLETVVQQELTELHGRSRESVIAYLRRGVVMSRLLAANMTQVFTDTTLHGVPEGKSRGIWAGMPFIRPASMGRAKVCLESLVAMRAESPEIISQAESDFLLLSNKLEEFVALCRSVSHEDFDMLDDDEVCNEFDPDYLRCLQVH